MAKHCTNSEFRRDYKGLKTLKEKSSRIKIYIKKTKIFAVSVVLWLFFTFGFALVSRKYQQSLEELE